MKKHQTSLILRRFSQSKMTDFEPAYIRSYHSGMLKQRAKEARRRLGSCSLCPRRCKVDRIYHRQTGICNTLEKAWVSSFHPHFGEEAPLADLPYRWFIIPGATIGSKRCNCWTMFLTSICRISSSGIRALLIGPGTVLFSLRSKLLRLQTEMPCARTDQFREISGIARIFLDLYRDFVLSCFRDKRLFFPSIRVGYYHSGGLIFHFCDR